MRTHKMSVLLECLPDAPYRKQLADEVEALERQLAEEKESRVKGDDANTLLRRQLAESELLCSHRAAEQSLLANRLEEAQARIAQLEEAAKAVIARWETPLWKDVPHTANFIHALRDAVVNVKTEVRL